MKKIEVIMRVNKFNEVKEQLKKIGYPGLTISHVEGHGKQKGRIQQFRGRQYKREFLPKMKVEIVVKDKEVEDVVEAIPTAAKTGEIGDGKIFIIPVQDAVRIRTGERGEIVI